MAVTGKLLEVVLPTTYEFHALSTEIAAAANVERVEQMKLPAVCIASVLFPPRKLEVIKLEPVVLKFVKKESVGPFRKDWNGLAVGNPVEAVKPVTYAWPAESSAIKPLDPPRTWPVANTPPSAAVVCCPIPDADAPCSRAE